MTFGDEQAVKEFTRSVGLKIAFRPPAVLQLIASGTPRIGITQGQAAGCVPIFGACLRNWCCSCFDGVKRSYWPSVIICKLEWIQTMNLTTGA
eukprot:589869-Amphidinium_carterae.1